MQEQLALTDEGNRIARRFDIAIETHPFAEKERKQCITASDLPKLMGLSKWGDTNHVIADKLGLTPSTTSYRMRRGNYMEGLLLSEALMQMNASGELGALKDSGKIVISLGEFLRRQDIPFGASLDALFRVDGVERSLLEFKTSAYRWSDGIPEDYQMQAKGQLLNLEEILPARFFVEQAGNDPDFVGEVELLDDEIPGMVELIQSAWAWVEKGIVPERVQIPKKEHLPKIKNKMPIIELPDALKADARRLRELQILLAKANQEFTSKIESMVKEEAALRDKLTQSAGLGGNYILVDPAGGKDPLVSVSKVEAYGKASVNKDLLVDATRAALDQTFEEIREHLDPNLFAKLHTEALTKLGNASALASTPGKPYPKISIKFAGLAAPEDDAE